MRAARQYLACLALASTLFPRASSAEEPKSASACPSLPAVLEALDQLLVAKLDASVAANIDVRDLGETWEITVAERKAGYADPARSCTERVRVATIFAALVLEPLGRESNSSKLVPPPVPSPVLPPNPTPPQPKSRHSLELGPAFVVVPKATNLNTATSWGGSLRWAFSGDHLGISSGISGVVPFEERWNRYGASMSKISLDVSMRITLHAGRFCLGTDIGPYGALLLTEGKGTSRNNSTRSSDAGGRLAVRLQMEAGRLSPFLALHAEWSLRKLSLVVDYNDGFHPLGQSGEIGDAPRIWLGAVVGAAFGL